MKLYISKVTAWHPELSDNPTADNYILPPVDFIPAIQRRRLSAFAKVAFFSAYQTLDGEIMPIVFSSRHGDLNKTATLLGDIANQDDLSPTSFSLSVHNAVPGLLSINTKNTSAITAISAGKDSFFMGLFEAYTKLKLNNLKKILVLHADLELPELFDNYKDEQQIPHSFACIASLTKPINNPPHSIYEIDIEMKHQKSTLNNELPSPITFYQWLLTNEMLFSYQSDNYLWTITKSE